MHEPPDEDSSCLNNLSDKDMKELASRWRRPALPALDPSTDSVSFQQLEQDYTIASTLPEFATGPNPEAKVTAEPSPTPPHVASRRLADAPFAPGRDPKAPLPSLRGR